jgi:hypothetical protein
MNIRDNATSSAKAWSNVSDPRRRSIETDRTSDEDRNARTRSNVERAPAEDREGDEIGPEGGYGGSGPDQTRPKQ